MACGGRLRLSDFWLNHDDVSLFRKSQWPVNRYIYLSWRIFLAVYLFGWLVCNLVVRTDYGSFFIYLTNWTFVVLTLYAVLSCVQTVYFTFKGGHTDTFEDYSVNTEHSNAGYEPDSSGSSSTPQPVPHQQTVRPRLPHYLKLIWLLFNVCLALDPVITVVAWSFLTPSSQPAINWVLDVHVHALNTVFIYADLLFSATPVRAVHFVYGCMYGTVYMTFTLIYYWAGGLSGTGETAIYPKILDWAKPGWTVLSLCLTVLAVVLSHLLGYGIYRLRLFIHNHYFGNSPEETRIMALS